jgi:hypothetical protein
VAEQALRVGPFEITVPASPSAAVAPGVRQVELEFTAAQQLPAGDGRAVGARLTFVGFVAEPLPPARVERFPEDLKKPLLDPAGVYDDGWVGPAASFTLAQSPDAETLILSGMVPKVAEGQGFTTELVITVDGREVARRTVGLDRFTIDLPVEPPTAQAAVRKVGFRFSRTQTLPAPDGRAVGARLGSVGFSGRGH